MGKKKLVAVLAGAVILTAVSGVAVVKRNVSLGETVTEVVDGDTFFIGNHQRVRIDNINAPELEYCYGQESKLALEKLVLNKKVVLVKPVVDYYKRIVASVFVDRISVGEYLIKNGYAIYESSNATDSYLLKANEFAREQKLGIFSPKCYQVDPPDEKCVIKGNLEDKTEKKTYYVPGCQFYKTTIIMKFKGEQWFCSEADAQKAGFEKSKYCR